MRRIQTARERVAVWHEGQAEDYRGQHRGGDADFGAPLHDVESMFPDYYTHPEYYPAHTPYDGDSQHAIMRARGRPDAKVHIYRALPFSARTDLTAEQAPNLTARERKGWFPLNTGDWVTTAYDYAKEHGDSNLGDQPWTIVHSTVPARSLYSEGNSIHEWSYAGDPKHALETPRAQGQRYRRQRQQPAVRTAGRHIGPPPLENTNPTGGLFVDYDPVSRTGPISSGLTTLDKVRGVDPRQPVTVYRGAPSNQKEIVPGDFITTNEQLARDYAGLGRVLQLDVPHSHVVTDPDEWEGEEYIYRPQQEQTITPEHGAQARRIARINRVRLAPSSPSLGIGF